MSPRAVARALRGIPRGGHGRAAASGRAAGAAALLEHPPVPKIRATSCSITPFAPRHHRAIHSSRTRNDVADAESSLLDPPTSPPSHLPVQTDLLELYRGLVAQGKLRWDEEQVRCVMKLRHLLETLADYSPPLDLLARLTPAAPYRAKQVQHEADRKGWWKRPSDFFGADEEGKELIRVLSGEEELANLKTPKGILITGPPGTGKSLLLSLFFSLLPTSHKKRHHYHAFTLSLYQRVFAEMERRRNSPKQEAQRTENMEVAARKGWKAVFANGRWDNEEGVDTAGWAADEETIPFIIARDMILEYHVLYFDELQLVDASSAALLRDVLSWYWRLGGVIVSCSNRVPDDLYYHGVQRERMAGFLEALKSRCEVVELDGGRDWRRGVDPDLVGRSTWSPVGSTEFGEAWGAVGPTAPTSVNVYGRKVLVPAASGATCRFSFADLCEEPLGPADYITLASTFRTFFIDEIPVLLLKNKNEARRLINLVDALYESRCQVFITAAAPPESIFFPDAVDAVIDDDNESIMAAEALSETLHAPNRPNVSLYNPSTQVQRERSEASNRASSFSVLSIFTGEDERFAYKRAVSRLLEMTTSPTYTLEEWLPLGKEGRRWELFDGRDSPSTSRRLRAAHMTSSNEDFAAEAEYSRPGRVSAGPRVNAPLISEKHVWGVRDGWGDKAGRWGKGAGAFEKK